MSNSPSNAATLTVAGNSIAWSPTKFTLPWGTGAAHANQGNKTTITGNAIKQTANGTTADDVTDLLRPTTAPHRPITESINWSQLTLPRPNLFERVAVVQAAVFHHHLDRVGIAHTIKRALLEDHQIG